MEGLTYIGTLMEIKRHRKDQRETRTKRQEQRIYRDTEREKDFRGNVHMYVNGNKETERNTQGHRERQIHREGERLGKGRTYICTVM